VLFFTKGEPTKNIWFYELDPQRSLGKLNPLNENDLAEFLDMSKTRPESINSWMVDMMDMDQDSFDLSVRNPRKDVIVRFRSPADIVAEMEQIDAGTTMALERIRGLL
jgi:type I restriction enzyme M protein